ncbi:unnamed protein product [Mucor hiemalis]
MRIGIERCFALLVQRWRFLFKYVYIYDPIRLVQIINACCGLENICIEKYDEETFMNHVHRLEGNRILKFHGDVHVELVFDPLGVLDEGEDQIDGYITKEKGFWQTLKRTQKNLCD